MRIGIDLGGTNIAGGLVRDDGSFVFKTSIPTVVDKGEDGLLAAILRVINILIEKADGGEISSIGIGVPGHADSARGVVVFCNNIPLVDCDLAGFIKKETGIPCFIENDANAAALGEVMAGSAKEFKNAVMITLGTGVGSGIILNNKVYSGANGAAGELGHICLFPDGIDCNCGRRGCFELYASATALKRLTREAMEKNPSSKLWELAKTLDGVTGKTAFDAARAGDAVGQAVVDEYVGYLSIGVVDIVNLLYPEAIIFGGGLAKEGENILAPIRKNIERESVSTYGGAPKLLVAELGNDAGIIGAAFLGE